MSERVTMADLARIVRLINAEADSQGLLLGESTYDNGSRYVYPHIGLDFGSKTFGQVWALYATGGTAYGSGRHEWGMGSLGKTKREALDSMGWYLCGLRESQKKTQHPKQERKAL